MDTSNSVFVVDRTNHRVQRWSAGKPSRLAILSISVMVGATSGVTVAGSTSDPGPWSYQFSSPTAITFDPQGFMYVLDFTNDRVQRWWPGATFGTTVAAAVLSSPRGMQFDRLGNIVITDTAVHRVISFGIQCRKYCSYLRQQGLFSKRIYLSFNFSGRNHHNCSTT